MAVGCFGFCLEPLRLAPQLAFHVPILRRGPESHLCEGKPFAVAAEDAVYAR
jgi:hypothetical protein